MADNGDYTGHIRASILKAGALATFIAMARVISTPGRGRPGPISAWYSVASRTSSSCLKDFMDATTNKVKATTSLLAAAVLAPGGRRVVAS